MKLYKSSLKIAARELRKNMTPTEEMIWFAVRRKKLLGIQFYRQKTLGPYIVDFYAPAVNLVIEIDGAHHLTADNIGQDQFRDTVLNELGLSVLRFSNSQVKNTLSKVMVEIITTIRDVKELPPLKKGWKKDDLLALLECIDWIIALPPELELQYTEIVEKIEEESNMAYVTSFERVGMQKGMQKGMEQGMQKGLQQGKEIGVQEGKVLGECEFLVNLPTTKFQIIPKNYLEKITQANGDTLMTWGRKLLFAPTIECVFEEKDA